MPSNLQLRRTLVDACRILDQNRLVHAYGHVSARAEDGRTLWISPRKGPGQVRAIREIFHLDLDGNLVLPSGSIHPRKAHRQNKNPEKLKPPLELFLHTEIYRARPDVNAICRTHGKFSLVMSILRRPLRPVHELAVPVGPIVPLLDSPELISSAEAGRRLVAALGSARALLLRGNGAVTVGGSIEEAVVNAILLETSAELQWRALAIGKPVWIQGDEYTGEYARLAKREYEAVLRPWEYYRARARGFRAENDR